MAKRFLLVGGLDDDAEQRLEHAGELRRLPSATEDELAVAVAEVDALIVRTHIRVTRRVLAAGRRLRVVGVAGVGTDKVDLAAAEALNVAVLNRPGAATQAVAEITVGLMLNLLRPLERLRRAYQAGRFREARAAPHGVELSTLTIGIIGLGRIGSTVGRIVNQGFGSRVLYNDIVDIGPLDFAAEPVSKERLWSESDIVTLHVPLTELTRGLVEANVLAVMKPTALLINASRGAVVNTDALVEALRTNQIAGAGLDVTHPEPLAGDHPLFGFANCIVLPHVAARTHGGIARMHGIVDDVIAYLRGTGS